MHGAGRRGRHGALCTGVRVGGCPAPRHAALVCEPGGNGAGLCLCDCCDNSVRALHRAAALTEEGPRLHPGRQTNNRPAAAPAHVAVGACRPGQQGSCPPPPPCLRPLLCTKGQTCTAPCVPPASRHAPAALQGDVRKFEDCERMVAAAVQRCGRLDILVNCAAGNFLSPAEQLSSNGFK